MFLCLIILYNSSFVSILHVPSISFVGPKIFLSTFLSNTVTFHYHLACSRSLWHNLETNQSSSTFRQLLEIHMSLIIWRTRHSFFYGRTVLVVEASRSHSDTPHSVGLLCTSDRPIAGISTWQQTTLATDIHPCPRGNSKPKSRPQTHALDRASTGIGILGFYEKEIIEGVNICVTDAVLIGHQDHKWQSRKQISVFLFRLAYLPAGPSSRAV